MNLPDLQDAIRQDNLFVSPHALTEAIADQLAIDDIWASILASTTVVIEDYPADPRGPSCLLLSFVARQPVHTVVAFPSKRYAALRKIPAIAFLVTVYRPDRRPHEWDADYPYTITFAMMLPRIAIYCDEDGVRGSEVVLTWRRLSRSWKACSARAVGV